MNEWMNILNCFKCRPVVVSGEKVNMPRLIMNQFRWLDRIMNSKVKKYLVPCCLTCVNITDNLLWRPGVITLWDYPGERNYVAIHASCVLGIAICGWRAWGTWQLCPWHHALLYEDWNLSYKIQPDKQLDEQVC